MTDKASEVVPVVGLSPNHPGWTERSPERTVEATHRPTFCERCGAALTEAEHEVERTGQPVTVDRHPTGSDPRFHRVTLTPGPRYRTARAERTITALLVDLAAWSRRELAEARSQVARCAEHGTARTIHDHVHELARFSEHDRLWSNVEAMTTRTTNPSTWREATVRVASGVLHEALGNGADDVWSGRTNDLRRVSFDARLEWVNKVVRITGVEVLTG